MVGGLGEFADWSGARILWPRPVVTMPGASESDRLFGAADMTMNLPAEGRLFFIPSVRNQVRELVYLLGEVNQRGPWR